MKVTGFAQSAWPSFGGGSHGRRSVGQRDVAVSQDVMSTSTASVTGSAEGSGVAVPQIFPTRIPGEIKPPVEEDNTRQLREQQAKKEQAESEKEATTRADAKRPDGSIMTAEEQEYLAYLRGRDREVRQHEQMHVAVGGQYITSGPNYVYEKGPDGGRYAVGGEVGIDASKEREPETTITKMQIVRAAALAPPETSAQDQSTAARASANEQEARQELRKLQAEARLLREEEAKQQREAREAEMQMNRDIERDVEREQQPLSQKAQVQRQRIENAYGVQSSRPSSVDTLR